MAFDAGGGRQGAKDVEVRFGAKFLADRPTGFGSWVNVTSMDLKITPDELDQPAYEVAGLSVFGGALQSSNFQTGQSGWRIALDGSMEVQSLVTRDWILDGSLADGVDVMGVGGTYAANNQTVLTAAIGPISLGQNLNLAGVKMTAKLVRLN